MPLLRFTVDLESAGDVTQQDFDEMAEKVEKYVDSVIGPQFLSDKQGDDGQVTYHVHRSNDRMSCPFCNENAADERGA